MYYEVLAFEKISAIEATLNKQPQHTIKAVWSDGRFHYVLLRFKKKKKGKLEFKGAAGW